MSAMKQFNTIYKIELNLIEKIAICTVSHNCKNKTPTNNGEPSLSDLSLLS